MQKVRAARERAQGLVEYGLVTGMVALLSVGGLSLMGMTLGTLFGQVLASVTATP